MFNCLRNIINIFLAPVFSYEAISAYIGNPVLKAVTFQETDFDL